MSKIIELQYNLANGENIESIHIDEYVAVRREKDNYVIHSQVRYSAELETHLIEAIIEPETAKKIEYLQINTVGGNRLLKYPLNLADLTDVQFPKLKSLIIPEQNLCIKTYIYDGFDETKENGVISSILNNCPNLKTLVLPSYPDNEFRNVKLSKLETLRIMDNNNPDRFLRLLSKTSKKNFPLLKTLQIADGYSEEVLNKFLKSPIGKHIS